MQKGLTSAEYWEIKYQEILNKTSPERALLRTFYTISSDKKELDENENFINLCLKGKEINETILKNILAKTKKTNGLLELKLHLAKIYADKNTAENDKIYLTITKKIANTLITEETPPRERAAILVARYRLANYLFHSKKGDKKDQEQAFLLINTIQNIKTYEELATLDPKSVKFLKIKSDIIFIEGASSETNISKLTELLDLKNNTSLKTLTLPVIFRDSWLKQWLSTHLLITP